MKGIVMTLLEDMILENAGLRTWQQLLDHTGLEGVYTAGGNYEDEQLFQLVDAMTEVSGGSRGELLCAFGQHMMSRLPDLYPVFFSGEMDFLSFLISVDSVIHMEVKKLYPDALLPSFEYKRLSQHELDIRYQSERKMCDMAVGLIRQSAIVFSVDSNVIHGASCLHHGADYCELKVIVNE